MKSEIYENCPKILKKHMTTKTYAYFSYFYRIDCVLLKIIYYEIKMSQVVFKNKVMNNKVMNNKENENSKKLLNFF